jgi:cell division protein FtsW
MAKKLKSDRWLFFTTLGLVAFSMVMVYSSSAAIAMAEHRRPDLFLSKQALFAVLGLAAMAIAMRVNYRVYRQPVVIWSLAIVTLVALAGVGLFGPKINGSRRWFAIMGIGIQPSELAKIAIIFFTAAVLERRMDRISEIRYALGPIAIAVGIVFGLIVLEPDYGTAMAVVAIAAVMVFAAGLSWRNAAIAGATLIPALGAIALLEPYRLRRLLGFLDPWADSSKDGYQLVQSLIAVGTGGVTGRGLMEGVQKLFYLPYPHTDFIYAVVAEELGLAGATALLICFCVITWRGLRVVTRAPDSFGSLLALGLTAMIALQALANISIVIGLLPTKGIPLPFVSAGGSSLIVSLAGMGVLLNVSEHASVEEA